MTTNDDSAGPVPADAARTARTVNARLLAAMSHEIRTPLYGMLGTLELLSMSGLEVAQRRQVATITESSRVLLQMLDHVLDFSRIEAGELRLDAVPFDPVALAETVARAQEPLAMRKGVALDCDLQPGVPWLLGDPLRVRQVLANLLRNAIKFTAQGRVTLRLWQEPHPSADRVGLMLEVADTGPGIDGALLPHLFEPFMQGEATRADELGGAGLGLAICRKLARLMGGDITADSAPGQGSRFTVALQLPATTSRPLRGAAGADAAPAMAALPQLGLRVLVVEDNPHNRLLLRGQLEGLGCAVQLASDGAQGLAACAAGAFDVVLTDVQMPVMDGYALSRRLRAAGNPVRIVALTANAGAGEAGRCHDAGMDRCLVKPVLLQELATCLQALVAGRARMAPVASGDADANAALLAQSVHADFDALLAAASRGDLGAVQAHAHHMRGTLAQSEAAREAAEVCRELEAGAAWAVQAAQDRIGDLGLILDACFPGYRNSRLLP
ncbi:ATP-binding protein [Cupriavidus consociatus]|uniref:ATP-binding protein n=1 Tax=Cupriavidus consociatus TaxID=2821357 RepID=UPI001AE82430|nr:MULTISPECIES: ATP-binding protein [unclassified Cupriavidus]MBP0620068.1 response regulator [Cupriavidus sp. LEh25]MDK2656723.1 ATP-binding protein [Cupriavidus sp. LEh21]